MANEHEQQNSEAIKRSNFEHLAENRMNNLVKKFLVIGELADKNTYAYTEQHIKQIIDTIETEMKQMKEKFRKGETQKTSGFTFRR